MKKTLLVTLDFFPTIGGIATYWERLGMYLPSRQWVVLAPPLEKDAPELSANYAIIRRSFLTRFFFPRWVPLFFHVLTVCRKERVERIIVAQILPIGTVVWFLAKVFHIPYIVSAHGLDIAAPLTNPRKRFLCSRILQSAQWVIVNSRATEGVVRAYGISEKKIRFVYPAPSITPALLSQKKEKTSAIPTTMQGKTIILTVGRLVKRKGHAFVLRALPGILAALPNVVYCIVGDGHYRDELIALARDLNIQDSVFFTGTLSSAAIAQWYDACSVFVMTPEDSAGDIEGFGIVYLEAQSFGKPVIGTRVSGVVEAVLDGATGVLVEQRNTVEIQKEIIHLLIDTEYAKKLGEAGRQRVTEEFQWKHQSEKLEYLLSL